MTHPLRVAENCTTHPLHKAQNLMTHPLSNLAHSLLYFLTSPYTQTYRDLYGDAMLVLTLMSSNMAEGN